MEDLKNTIAAHFAKRHAPGDFAYRKAMVRGYVRQLRAINPKPADLVRANAYREACKRRAMQMLGV